MIYSRTTAYVQTQRFEPFVRTSTCGAQKIKGDIELNIKKKGTAEQHSIVGVFHFKQRT
jgi:hypothetical protein